MSLADGAGPTILNVDDNEGIRYLRSRILTDAGYRVIEAGTGEDALLLAKSLLPGLVVLDVNLPGMDGLEVCRQIKQSPDTAHIMVIQVSSAASAAQEAATCHDGGADGLLLEPIERLELVGMVRALLRLAGREADARRLVERHSRLERHFAEATEAADCGIWDWEIRTGKLEWFGTVERLAGLRPGSFSGKIEEFSSRLHADDRARVWEKLEGLMSRREPHFDDEHRFVHPDGSVHWVSAKGRFFYDDEGQAVRMTGVVQDITRRKLAEERQQAESESRRLLACAAEQLLATHNPAELMSGVFETVRRHLDLDGYIHYRVDESGTMLDLEACAGMPDGFMADFQRLKLGQSLCGLVAQRRTPVVYERLYELADEKARLVSALGFHAYVCHPLLVGDRLLGTLAFASKSRDRFVPDELSFMQTIARYVAAAMDRLRLEAETRERAERLRESEAHLRAAMDLNPQIPWTATPEGAIEDIHERWLQFSGLTRADALGDAWMNVVHEADLDPLLAAWQQALRTGESLDFEFRLRAASGGYRWMRSRAFPHRDGQGRIVRWYGTTEEIHDRKLAEEALLDSRARLEVALQFREAVMANIKDGLYTLDRDGLVTYVNPAAEKLFGWSSAELLGRKMHSITHYLHRDGTPFPAEQCAGLQVLREGQTLCQQTDVFIRKDGTFFDAVYSSAPIWSEGRIAGVVVVFRDVTAQRAAEQALRESEERFRTMAQTVPSFLFEADAEGSNIWTSDAWCRFTGQTPEQVDGHGWADALHPDDRAANGGRWTDCMREGVPFESRQRLRRRDGYYAWVIAKALPVRDEQGNIYRWLGSVTDVDEIVRAEEALRESEERFRTLADHSPDPIWVTGPEGVQFVNAAYCRFFGVVIEDVRGGQWELLLHPDDAEAYLAAHRKASEEHAPFRAQARVKSADGSWRWIDSRGAVRRSPSGAFLGHVGSSPDITDMKLAEEALRRSEEQLRVITDAVPSFIAYVDREERYRFVNGEYEKWIGLPRCEIVGRSVQDLLKSGYRIVQPYIRRVLNGEAVRFEREILSGTLRHTVMTTYTPDVREDGTIAGFYVQGTDITERKRHEEQLRQWKDELEKRVALRTQELVASQERLRALASQLSLTEQRERRKLALDLHDYLAQLLVVGRIKVSQLRKPPGLPAVTHAVARDIDDILTQALTYTRTMIAELCPPSLHESGLPAALKWLGERMYKDGLWVEVQADCERLLLPEDRAVLLFQSVRELLFNVLKHARVDRATVRVTVADGGNIRVAVEDRGKGFTPSDLARAIEPGHVGLAGVRERMEAIGGRLEVSSTPGEGTTMTMVLPGP